ncbi:MAG: serine hydrolase domain-containing protein [Polyangiaceae bacterium]
MVSRIRRSRFGLQSLALAGAAFFASAALTGCAAPAGEDTACAEEAGCAEAVADSSDELIVFTLGKKRWQVTSPFADRSELQDTLAQLAASDTAVVDMTAGPDGSWVILTATDIYSGGPLPSGMAFWLSFMASKGQQPKAVDINSDGGYVIIADGMYHVGGSVNQDAKDKIAEYYNKGWKIRDVETTPSGYVILGDGSLASYANTGEQLMALLADRIKSKRRVEQVEIGLDGGWVVISDQEAATAQASSTLRNSLKAAAKSQSHMSKLMLAENGGFVLYSNGTALGSGGNVAEAIEYGTGGQNIWERMDFYGVPGVSISVIENNKVTYSRGYGVLKQGEEQHVLATTPFDMASLSKFVGALTMMKLDSDAAYNYDVDWSVVNQAKPNGNVDKWLTAGENNPGTYGFANVDVSNTLSTAHFMRHQTDFIQSGGSPGWARGAKTLSGETWQWMLGWDCTTSPCGYNKGKRAWSTGGSGPVAYDYDSVNFLIPQAIAEDLTGKEAWEVLDDMWFKPMGLKNITGYTWSRLMDIGNVAWQHNSSGPRGTLTVYPWTFAGGIYAAPMDYAELMILALNQGKDSSGVQRIPASAINRMLQVQNGNVGFGLFGDANADITEVNDNRFRHNGAHSGRARTTMCGNPTRDGGIVITINANLSDVADANGQSDSTDFINWLMNEYMQYTGWPGDCL